MSTFNPYEKAAVVHDFLEKTLEEFPITKENIRKYQIMHRTIMSDLSILESMLKQF